MTKSVSVFLISVLLCLCVSCKDKAGKGLPVDTASASELAVQRVEIKRLESELDDLRQQNAHLRGQMLVASESIAKCLTQVLDLMDASDLDPENKEAVALLTQQKSGVHPVNVAADELNPQGLHRKGWPWFIKIILVIAIVLVCFLLYKRVINEAEEEGLDDEEFVEENDLGTIRYPRAMQEGSKPSSK